MDFKLKGITWVGDFYQKFEEVCQEVDDIFGQDAVKYLGNQVQNVGDGVKRFCSDVVQDVLPPPPLVNPVKHGYRSLALNNNVDSSLESVAAGTVNKERAEENPVNNIIESFHDSDANNLTNSQHGQASIGLDLVNQVNHEILPNSSEVEDSCSTREEVSDNSLRETASVMKENLDVGLVQNAVKSIPELLNEISLNEKKPLESSVFSDSLDSLASSEVLLSTMLSEGSCLSESDSLSARSQVSYCSEIDSCKEHSVVAGCTLDSSMVLVSRTATPNVGVAGQFLTSQAGPSCGSNKSMELHEGETSAFNEVMPSNNLFGTSIGHGEISSAQERAIISVSESDERLASSIDSSMEDIQLRDDVKLGESCFFVDDMELHAASSRAQRLRSYKKRIKDAFGRKKRLEKEYEQLAIWYGDSDVEFSKGTSQTYLDSKNLQVQNLCETEWEILFL